eukprot:1013220_1
MDTDSTNRKRFFPVAKKETTHRYPRRTRWSPKRAHMNEYVIPYENENGEWFFEVIGPSKPEGQSSSASSIHVKRERARVERRVERRKRNREVFKEVVTCDLSVEGAELQFMSQIVPRERAESVTVEE